MTRPLIDKTVVELEATYKASERDRKTLMALHNELKCRKTRRAIELRINVNKSLLSLKKNPVPDLSNQSANSGVSQSTSPSVVIQNEPNAQSPDFSLHIASNASERLRNAFQEAIEDKCFPFVTLNEYFLLENKLRRQEVMQIPNIGFITAIEFEQLAQSFLHTVNDQDLRNTYIICEKVPSKEVINNSVNRARSNKIFISRSSPRIETKGRSIQFNNSGFLGFVQVYGSDKLISCVKKIPKGRKAPFSNLESYLESDKSERVSILEHLVPSMRGAVGLELDDIVLAFVEKGEVELSRVSEGSTVGELLDCLSEREETVVRMRYGLGCAPETLEAVGEELDVTRERIRQIQKKALGKIQKTLGRLFWQARIDSIKENLVNEIFGASQILVSPKPPSGETKLLLDGIYGGLNKFLESVATSWGGNWVHPDIEIVDCELGFSQVKAVLNSQQSPVNIHKISTHLDLPYSLVTSFIQMLTDYSEYDGWIIDGACSPRKRRAVNILNLVSRSGIGTLFDLWKLKVEYRKSFVDDQCSGRDLRLVLENYKHLFVNLCELGWMCISEAQSNNMNADICSLGSTDIENAMLEEPPGPNTGGLVDSIYQLFLDLGPMPLKRARKAFFQRHPSFSKSSFDPMLITYPVFCRLAPGVFGLQKHLVNSQSKTRAQEFLLHRRHVEVYICAKNTGFPIVQYPLWDAEMENKWRSWLRENQEFELLAALSEEFSVDANDGHSFHGENFLEQKKLINNNLLQQPINVVSKRISAQHCMHALLAASIHNVTNWMHVNQALGWRVETSARVALVLAVLIHLGHLEGPNTWYKAHKITKGGLKIIEDWKEIKRSDTVRLREFERNLFDVRQSSQIFLGWAQKYRLDELACLVDIEDPIEIDQVFDDDIDVDDLAGSLNDGSLSDWLC